MEIIYLLPKYISARSLELKSHKERNMRTISFQFARMNQRWSGHKSQQKSRWMFSNLIVLRRNYGILRVLKHVNSKPVTKQLVNIEICLRSISNFLGWKLLKFPYFIDILDVYKDFTIPKGKELSIFSHGGSGGG